MKHLNRGVDDIAQDLVVARHALLRIVEGFFQIRPNDIIGGKKHGQVLRLGPRIRL